MNRDPELVTASEIASWAWCPESWRLESGLGLEPQNRAALERGESLHQEAASFEESSRSMLGVGALLVVAAAVVGLLLFLGAFR